MNPNYDVVIIGSGPAGATYARTIKNARPSTRVLMVEAGPEITTPAGRHVRTIRDAEQRVQAQLAAQGPDADPDDRDDQVARALSPSRGRSAGVVARPGTWLVSSQQPDPGETGFPAAAMSANVGGMGSHWSGACPWPGEGETGDMISADELEPDFDEARRLLQVTQHAFDGAHLGVEVRSRLGAQFDDRREPSRRVQPMPLAMEVLPNGERYWTGTDVIMGDLLESSEGFELRANTVARGIHTTGRRADGVLLHDRQTGNDYSVSTRTVVVAADSLRTPQLLYVSGLRPRALGHYLNEHTMTTSTIQLDPALRQYAVGMQKTSAGGVDLLAGVNWIPFDRESFPFHGQITQWDASPIPVDDSFEAWPGSVVECSLFMGKADVRYEDHVAFDESVLDVYGLPAPKIHYTFTVADQTKLDQAVAEAARIGHILGEPINGLSPAVMAHGASLHYQGTTRFGTDDQTSTLDTRMRVWGTENVYVGGNGTIAAPAACNPTLTNVALSVRGARDLVAGL